MASYERMLMCFPLFLLLTGIRSTIGGQRQRKVYSIGDLHGDFARFRDILERLGIANFTGDEARWTGDDSILVSTGDSVDRGEHGRPIYMAFQQLAQQALDHGGEVVNIIGNHELMNLQNDLRYVHPAEMSPNGDYGGKHERKLEWGRNGMIGEDIRKRYVAAAVRDGTLFVHGGLDPDIFGTYGEGAMALDAMNADMRELLDMEVVGYDHKLLGPTGPFWNRLFAGVNLLQACEKVERTLRIAGANRMVIGHTPQVNGVTVRCEGPSGPRIVLGDTIISRAYEQSFGFSRASAIEYSSSGVAVHYFPEGQQSTQRVPLASSTSEF